MASLKQWMSSIVQNLSGHVGTLLSSGVHGMTGWGSAPKALESTAASGSETTVARGDHVHPTTGLMTTAHPANLITGFGSSATALGTASAGSATTLSRSDHVHPMPSASDVDALPIGGGTLTGTLSLSVSSGERAVNIGTQRTADGNAVIRLYATADGASCANIVRVAGKNGEIRIKQEVGSSGVRVIAPYVYIRNATDTAWAPISCGAVVATSVTVNGVSVSVDGHTHDYAASSHSHALGDLSNVTLSSVSTGHVIRWNGTAWVNASLATAGIAAASHTHNYAASSHSHAIGDLPTPTSGTPAALGTASRGSATTLSQSDHVHPMPSASDVGALPIGGGTLTGSLSLSTGSGAERTVNIGTGRTSDGNSFLRFYATNGGSEDAAIYRIGGEDSQLVIRQSRGTGAVRFRASVVYVRNAADSAYAPIGASAFNINSDPRAKQAIRRVGSVPTPRALGDAVIEFEWARGGDGRRHVGFNAATIREIAPLASVDMLADPETGESELGVDLAAVIAIQARQIGDLADRLDALESRR